jgi:hypothetical protein
MLVPALLKRVDNWLPTATQPEGGRSLACGALAALAVDRSLTGSAAGPPMPPVTVPRKPALAHRIYGLRLPPHRLMIKLCRTFFLLD